MELLRSDRIRKLKPEFCTLPAQAIQCRLHGVMPKGVSFRIAEKYCHFKPWPNALDFSLYNAGHSCIVKCRERLATWYSEVERVLLCRVKFDQSQIFERCRVLSRAFGHPNIQS